MIQRTAEGVARLLRKHGMQAGVKHAVWHGESFWRIYALIPGLFSTGFAEFCGANEALQTVRWFREAGKVVADENGMLSAADNEEWRAYEAATQRHRQRGEGKPFPVVLELDRDTDVIDGQTLEHACGRCGALLQLAHLYDYDMERLWYGGNCGNCGDTSHVELAYEDDHVDGWGDEGKAVMA